MKIWSQKSLDEKPKKLEMGSKGRVEEEAEDGDFGTTMEDTWEEEGEEDIYRRLITKRLFGGGREGGR